MEKKRGIDLSDLLSDDFDEDEEEYGYEDYEEYIEDDIYADHGEYDEYGDDGLGKVLSEPSAASGKPSAPLNMSAAASNKPVDQNEPMIFSEPRRERVEPTIPVPPPNADLPEAGSLASAVKEAAASVSSVSAPDKSTKPDEKKTPETAGEEKKPAEEFSDEPPKGDDSITLEVPMSVMEIIDILREHTYTCYLVGECVNMLYLGERVMDFDIVCNASLDRIIAIFDERFKTREDLLTRGELIIINGGMGISVAPYRSRIDGSGKPIYCKTIDEDLHRRTFTSETVAYNPYAGIYDPFGGLACISEEKTILKAIDEEIYERMDNELASRKRKKSDEPTKVTLPVLRDNPETILIAMQKYARGEAEISPFTLKNINDNAELLDMMMPSEIAKYFRRIILGRRITETMLAFDEVMFEIFPILRCQKDFDQKSEYQEYTLYEHTAKSVGYAFPDYAVRLALLLHEIGKYDCAADRGDHMTFYGHSERGVMLARDVFEDYEVEDAVKERVLFMIMHHDDRVSPENVVSYTEFCGLEYTRLLLLLQSANVRAKSSDPVNERVSSTLRQLADNITTLGSAPRAQTRKTATLDGLRSITDMIGRNGI